jgi:hypothetical protein
MVHNATTNAECEYLKIASIAISVRFSEVNIVTVNIVQHSSRIQRGVSSFLREAFVGVLTQRLDHTADQAEHYGHQENT